MRPSEPQRAPASPDEPWPPNAIDRLVASVAWTGSLLVEGAATASGAPVLLQRGELVGELVIFHARPQQRTSTITANESGLVATLTPIQLCELVEAKPHIAAKLIFLLTATGLRRQAGFLRTARAARVSAAMQHAQARTVFHAPLKLEELRAPSAKTMGTRIATAPGRFRQLLREKGFDGHQAELLCDACEYLDVHDGDVIIEAGTPWQHILFLLDGALRYDEWEYELNAAGTVATELSSEARLGASSPQQGGARQLRCVGSIGFFGDALLSDTTRVRMISDGVVASISFEQINALMATEGHAFAQRMIFFLGQSALRLANNIETAQYSPDPDVRTEEPHVFSVPFASVNSAAQSMALFDPTQTYGFDDTDDAALIGSFEHLYAHKLKRLRNGKRLGMEGVLAYLRDEVSLHEKEALFSQVLATSSLFEELSSADCEALARFMTVLRFDTGSVVVRRGEPSSWFGILLTGTLRVDVVSGEDKHLRRGSLLGELLPWQNVERPKRSSTIKGHESGFLATMLVPELRTFCEEYPESAVKFMRLLVTSALRKQHSNLRSARAARLGPPKLLASPTPHEHVHPSAPSILRKLLGEKGFDHDEVDALCDTVDFFEVKQGDVLLQAGQMWPYVVFLVRGAIEYEAWNYVIRPTSIDANGEACQKLKLAGTVALFGNTMLSDTSRVRMVEDGTIAGLTFEHIESLCDDSHLEHKLLYLLSQSAVRLSANIVSAQQLVGAADAKPVTGFDLEVLRSAALPQELLHVPMERFHRDKLIEQYRAATRSAGTGSEGGAEGQHLRDQVDRARMLHRMTLQKMRAVEAESETRR